MTTYCEWRRVPDTDCFIDSLGNVYGPKGVLKLAISHGYLTFSCRNVKLNKRLSLLHHRVYWEAFRGKIPPGMVINHIDGIRHNNTLSNLEVVTQKENVRHSIEVLGNLGYIRERKFDEARYLTLLTLQAIWDCRKLERHYGFSKNSLASILGESRNKISYPLKFRSIVCFYHPIHSRVRGNCVSYWVNVEGRQIKLSKEEVANRSLLIF